MAGVVDPRTVAALLRALGEAGAISSFELTQDGGVKATFSGAPRAFLPVKGEGAAPVVPPDRPSESDSPDGWDLVLDGKAIESRWIPPETTTTADDIADEPAPAAPEET